MSDDEAIPMRRKVRESIGAKLRGEDTTAGLATPKPNEATTKNDAGQAAGDNEKEAK